MGLLKTDTIHCSCKQLDPKAKGESQPNLPGIVAGYGIDNIDTKKVSL